MKPINRRLRCLLPFCFGSLFIHAQARLVINGGIMVIDNGAALVIDNPDNTAIVRTGSGYIKSERPDNRVLWTIGAGSSNTYLLPFGNGTAYLPMQFTAAAGTGSAGYFIVSTYPTATWKNSEDLPPGVTNVNRSGIDNSANVIDRFWQISPQGYTIKPSLTNLVLTYSPADFAAPNTITEANLIAQRWNSVSNSWSDYIPPAIVNTANNTVTVTSIAGSQLYNWWTLVDMNAALPVTLAYFTAAVENDIVIARWQTLLERNTAYFELWRSKDGQAFEYAGRLPAAGNSSLVANYDFTDIHPYSGKSYYRLKTIDKDGRFAWSATAVIYRNSNAGFSVFPNPAKDYIVISSNAQIINEKPIVTLYDAHGRQLRSFVISHAPETVSTALLTRGAYILTITFNSQVQSIPFIKN